MKALIIITTLLSCGLFNSSLLIAAPVSKDNSVVEKMIVVNKKLSDLDHTLNDDFQLAMINAEDPVKLREEQRKWLHTFRDSCKDEKQLEQVYLDRIKALTEVTKYTWITYQNKNYGIEFSYPSNRKIIEGNNQKKANISIIDKLKSRYSNINIEIMQSDLKKALEGEELFFQSEDGKWMVDGGYTGPIGAVEIAGKGWKGYSGIQTYGISDENGFHAAGGEHFKAILSNGKKAIEISTDSKDDVDRIIQSIRLLE